MERKEHETNLIITYPFRSSQTESHIPSDFTTAYDIFIGESSTEFFEGLIYDLAHRFYDAGYLKGKADANAS